MTQFLFVAAQTKALTGGSELLWSQVALRLAKMGHSVTVSLPTGGTVFWWRGCADFTFGNPS